MIIKCAICGIELETRIPNQKYCSGQCRRKAEKIQKFKSNSLVNKCECCGKTFAGKINKKYCSDKCRSQAYLKRTWQIRQLKKSTAAVKFKSDPEIKKITPKTAPKKVQGKTLGQWAREAEECRLDYGTYRALSTLGKTFDELKAAAQSRVLAGHSHLHIVKKRW